MPTIQITPEGYYNLGHTTPQPKPNSDVVYFHLKMKVKHNPFHTWLPLYADAKTMARAHTKIAALVKSAQLPAPRTQPCVICGYGAVLWHHHVSYLPPDDVNVVAMCYDCHTKVHTITLEF